MILVDYREGSKELAEPLVKMGLPVEVTELPFGDFAFTGRGPGGKSVDVGVEYKQLRECVSSLRTGRLQGHQLPGMRGTPPLYDFAWLLIEGELRFNQRGVLLRRTGRREFKPMPGGMTISEFNKRLLDMHLQAGLVPWHTANEKESVEWIADLYRTWTDKAWEEHKAHIGMYHAPTLIPISDERRALCALPGVGAQVSKAAIEKFGTVKKAMNAPLDAWAGLTTTDEKGGSRRFGEKAAQRVVNFLEGK